MIKNIPPATWSSGQTVAPEKLNRNMLSAQQQLEAYANNRWRRWNTEAKWSGQSGSYVILPSVTGSDYVVERVTFSGRYSGQPTLFWDTNGTAQSFQFPDHGAVASDYDGTVLPGVLISGADNADRFFIEVNDGTVSNMRMIFGLRSDRNSGGDSRISGSSLVEYSDNDALIAATFTSQVATLQSFADEWIAADSPPSIYPTSFTGVTSSTNLSQRTDRIPGSENITVVRLVGVIDLGTAGAALQTVTISYGFGTASASLVVPVAGENQVNFTSGTIAVSSTSRDVLLTADDFVITVTNSGTSSITKIDINVVSHR